MVPTSRFFFMCDIGCEEFGERVIKGEDVLGKDVLEVGSRNMNGSMKKHVRLLGPSSYVGIDIQVGGGVDIILDAKDICKKFGEERFDLVISTEMLEHVKDWRTVISQMKRVLRPGGILIITTRSKGCPQHDYPSDFWRFEQSDMRAIFSDMEITHLENDPTDLNSLPGVFVRAVKPCVFAENDLSKLKLYSINTGRKEIQ